MNPLFLAAAALISLATLAQGQLPRAQRPVKMFNGEDLSGWEGNPALWSVADGAITGVSEASGERQLTENSFLIYKAGTVDDFELTFKARVTGNNNSGVQYRSHVTDVERSTVAGYQLDIHPRQNFTGMLYEEGGRGILARRGALVRISPDKGSQVLGTVDSTKKIDVSKWNDYSILARGTRLIHRVNGEITCSAVDDDPERRSVSGVIAIELRAGAPMKVEVKDLVLQRYNRAHATGPMVSPVEVNVGPIANATPEWIWTRDELAPTEVAYFRRPWKLEKDVESASLRIAAEGGFTAFVNGAEVGTSNPTDKKFAYSFDIKDQLAPNYNHLAIRAQGGAEPAGLIAHLAITHTDGSTSDVSTDRSWIYIAADDEPPGWKINPHPRRGWKPARVIGKLGIEPWGEIFQEATPIATKKIATHTTTLPGFKLDKIYEVPTETQGSWVALTAAGPDRLIASAEDGGLYQIKPPSAAGPAEVEAIDLPIRNASGLAWAFGSLFVSVDGERGGLYRLDDSDNDGKLDASLMLKSFQVSGNHGPHGLALGPSPASLFVVGGNGTALPSRLGRRRPPAVWGDDQLLPANQPDSPPLPGGWICMTRTKGLEWELHSVGLRNPYDIAFNQHGDLFTCDADSPADRGTPFHRPTSIYHVPRGTDFGARGVGKNFPAAYPDTLPPILELESGTPSGLTFGSGAAFPARYQNALFVCDWSRRTIDAVHLTPSGASYKGEREEFLSGPDLRVTDIVISPDGAMYFTSGGRQGGSALWRVTYTGDEATTPIAHQPFAPDLTQIHALRQRLGDLQGVADKLVVATVWPHLRNRDRYVRHAARTALEHHDPKQWLERFGKERDVSAILEAAIALARTGKPEHQPAIIEKLASLELDNLSVTQKTSYLRAHGLAFIRLAPPSPELRKRLAELLAPHFPSNEAALDLELSRMLIYLDAPDAVEKTLALMDSSESAIAYATFLAAAKDGWTPETKQNYLAWFENAENSASQMGGSDLRGYLDRLKDGFFGEEPPKTNE